MEIDNLFLISMGNKVSISDHELMETMSKKEMVAVQHSCIDRPCFSRDFLFASPFLALSDHHLEFNYDDDDIAEVSKFVSESQGDCLVIKTLALYKNTSLISSAMTCFLSDKGVQLTDIGMLDLCVTEIFNNVIEHAYLKESSDPIVLVFSCIAGEVSVAIFDQAEKMPQEILVNASGADVGEGSDSGRGIGIVQAVMDKCSVYFENNRNAFLMSKKFEVHGCV